MHKVMEEELMTSTMFIVRTEQDRAAMIAIIEDERRERFEKEAA